MSEDLSMRGRIGKFEHERGQFARRHRKCKANTNEAGRLLPCVEIHMVGASYDCPVDFQRHMPHDFLWWILCLTAQAYRGIVSFCAGALVAALIDVVPDALQLLETSLVSAASSSPVGGSLGFLLLFI
jgi:hypothetical protein